MKVFRIFAVLLTALIVFYGFRSAAAGLGSGMDSLLGGTNIAELAFIRAVPENYPDADVITVASSTFLEYDPDGAFRVVSEWYDKILTEKGKRGAATVSTWFNAAYGDAGFELVRIIKPDGKTVDVDITSNSRTMIDPSQMNANIYDPNNKVTTISIPGLEIGDLLQIRTRDNIRKARMANFFCDSFAVEHTSPILLFRYEISAPAELPLKHVFQRKVNPEILDYSKNTTKNGRVNHVWNARDLPQAFPEPDMPAMYAYLPGILVSTAENWEEISRWYWNLCKPRLESITPEIKEKVAELTKNANSRNDKIRSIFRFVSQQIRYMGVTPEENSPGYEPHDVSLTFRNRYGVCRDKAALLAAMLRTAGLDAYPVIIHVGEQKDPEVPMPYFNHAIAAVRTADRRSFILMDPTNESTASLLPEYLCEKSYLVATPEGEPLHVSEPVDPSLNMLEIETTGTISESNSGICSATGCVTRISFSGVNDTVYRAAFSSFGDCGRIRFGRRILSRVVPAAVLTGLEFSPTDLQDTSIPLSVRFSYDIPYIVSPGKASVIEMPYFSKELGVANLIFPSTSLETRKYPVKLDIPCGVTETVSMSIPARMTPKPRIVAKPLCMDTDCVSFSSKTDFNAASADGNPAKYVSHNKLVFRKSLFQPEEYENLREAARLRNIAYRLPFATTGLQGVRKTTAAAAHEDELAVIRKNAMPDSAVDSVFGRRFSTDIRRLSSNAWAVSEICEKLVATYDGKIAESDVSASFFPDFSRADITNAVSISPSGDVHEAAALERHVMDQPWVSSAPRYPPGRKLVVNLPGTETGSVISYVRKFETIPEKNAFFGIRIPIRLFGGYAKRDISVSGTNNAVVRIVNLPEAAIKTSIRDGFAIHVDGPERNCGEPPETNMTPISEFMGVVEISAETAGQYIRRLEAAIRKLASAPAPKMELAIRKAALGLGSAPTVGERVKLVRDFIAAHIRTVGVGFWNFPLSELSSPDKTLDSGYGHQLDKIILAKAMLRALGVSSTDLFLNSSWAGAAPDRTGYPAAPAIYSDFDDAALRITDGEHTYFIDNSSQYAKIESTRFEDMLCVDGDSFELTAVKPAAPKLKTATDVSVDAKISRDGAATLSVTVKYFGNNAESVKKRWTELLPEMRSREILSEIRTWAESAKLIGKFDHGSSNSAETETFTIQIRDFAKTDGKTMIFRLPDAGIVKAAMPLYKRKTPFLSFGPENLRANWKITLPDDAGEILFAPAEYVYASPNGAVEYSRRISIPTGNVILFSTQMVRKAARLSPEEYDELACGICPTGLHGSDSFVISGNFDGPSDGQRAL